MKFSKSLRKYLKLIKKKDKEKFTAYFEGLGDILVKETSQKKNELVISSIQRMGDIINFVFELQEKKPNKFKELFLGKDFFDNYKDKDLEKAIKSNFDDSDISRALYTPINQMLRISENSINQRNYDISIAIDIEFYRLLNKISKLDENKKFITLLLEKIYEISRLSIKNNVETSFSWYINNVYNSEDFNLPYLIIFNKTFFNIIQLIIDENNLKNFEIFVKSIYQSIYIFNDPSRIFEYGYLLMYQNSQIYKELNIQTKIESLNKKEKNILSLNDLNEWKAEFTELTKIIDPKLGIQKQEEAEAIKLSIHKSLNQRIKLNNLLELLFAIGAYSFYKKRYDLINRLWFFKQQYRDYSVGQHKVIPTEIEELIIILNNQSLFNYHYGLYSDNNDEYWIFYRKYFFLLLLKIIQASPKNSDGSNSVVDDFSLPVLTSTEYQNIIYKIDGYIKLAENFVEKEKILINILNFDVEEIDYLNENLILLLKNIKRKSEDEIDKIEKNIELSAQIVNEFIDMYFENFKNYSKVKRIYTELFNNYRLDFTIKNNIDLLKNKIVPDLVIDKKWFFDDLSIKYFNKNKSMGEYFAKRENTYLLKLIISKCRDIPYDSFDELILEFNNIDNLFIISTNLALNKFFRKKYNYIDYLQMKETNNLIDGYYRLNNFNIPIINVYDTSQENYVILLDKTKSGKLIQYSLEKIKESDQEIRESFLIKIKTFSSDNSLLEDYLKNPPEWLKEKGDIKNMRDYLLTQAIIQISESLKIEFDEDFIGYNFQVE